MTIPGVAGRLFSLVFDFMATVYSVDGITFNLVFN